MPKLPQSIREWRNVTEVHCFISVVCEINNIGDCRRFISYEAGELLDICQFQTTLWHNVHRNGTRPQEDPYVTNFGCGVLRGEL